MGRVSDKQIEEAESTYIDLDEPASLEDMYGCDPWDDEHFGKHPASRDRA